MAATADADLLAVISDLSFARDLSRVTEIVRRAARRLTKADGVTFVLRDADQCYYADEDAIAPLWKGRRFPMATCISGWVMTHREAVVIPDIYADARIPHDAYRPTFVKSLLMVPVRPEEPVAAIGAYWADPHAATAAEREVLEVLARAASLALSNVQLWADLTSALSREQEARHEAETAKRSAEDANRLKDQFLATVSHELRTPLNVMQGWLWHLRQSQPTPERLEKAVATLEKNTELQTRLVEDLLDVSRAAAGRLKIDAHVVEIASLARLVVDVSQPAAAEKGVTLACHTQDATPPLVVGDAERLQQVLWNLIANAIKFTPAGGRVDVMVGRADGRALVEVRDSGIGIEPEFLPHMFDQFRQAESTPTRRYGGLGIGLTIVQQLVRLHGGTVTAQSDGVGKGTTVRVSLPIPAVTSEAGPWLRRRVGTATASPPLEGLTLLVIDDEPDACEALRQILEQQGATVYAAASADDALAITRSVTPHLVVADLAMPGKDGFTFLEELRRQSSRARQIPAAALSALSAAEYEGMATAAGFQLFLQKPIAPDVLTQRLAALARGGNQVH